MLVRSVFFRRLRALFSLLMRKSQILAINRVDEENEPPTVLAGNSKVLAKLADRRIEKRHFHARRGDVAIELDQVEGLEIEVMPSLVFEPLLLGRSKPCFVWVLRCESGKPVVKVSRLRALQARAVGFPEFFTSSSV